MKWVEEANQFEHNGLTHSQVWFYPDVDIHCKPPYIKGQKDSCWVKYRYPPVTREEWEKCLGMSIQPYPTQSSRLVAEAFAKFHKEKK